jgi:hypothetical protein
MIPICAHMKHSTLVMRMYEPSPGRMFHMSQITNSDTNLHHKDECSLNPESRPCTYSSLATDMAQFTEKIQNKKLSAYSDLLMYEAFYFGDENKETITGKNVSCFKPVNQS